MSVPAGSQAATGFYLTGCLDFSSGICRLGVPAPSKPALFMATDPEGHPATGLMFQTLGQSGQASLPLQQPANGPEHNPAAATLSISGNNVTLDTTSGFQPADTIDAWLVSHGTAVQARSIKVGGGN
ncbi:hypothetical protein [Arthrobacter sp. NEB 688]|uniref:hypothetical protein n=1 Tax=Arthrobacter sp. NEB 688 TaxID=904039 RepID=UPI001563B2FB|nr:hypothetical protein [Arthrobacter sp. NEB 688]QKE84654.1 hypothetical protein HL663_12375 [Arthrobacter sp. NEB 688]